MNPEPKNTRTVKQGTLPAPPESIGAELIAKERQRQQHLEGWTPKHDDEHTSGELSGGAVSYAACAHSQLLVGGKGSTYGPSDEWAWDSSWWKPSDDPVRNLVKAGALIAAEIDRLKRLPAAPEGGDS